MSMNTLRRELVDREMQRLGLPLSLDETYPAGDYAAEGFLDALWAVARAGADAREDGQAVEEEAAQAVAQALFALNFGGRALAAELDSLAYQEARR